MSIKDIDPSKFPTVIVECCSGDVITIAPEDLYDLHRQKAHDFSRGMNAV